MTSRLEKAHRAREFLNNALRNAHSGVNSGFQKTKKGAESVRNYTANHYGRIKEQTGLDNKKFSIIVIALIVILGAFYFWWINSDVSVETIEEPFESQIKYQSKNKPVFRDSVVSTATDPLPQSSSETKNPGDTTDIYAGVQGLKSSQMKNSQLDGIYNGQFGSVYNDQDMSAFDLSKNDPYNADFASMAGLQKTFQNARPKNQNFSTEYVDPSLPTQDMSQRQIDPTSPDSYMYDRNIFSNPKPKSKNPADMFRGDLEIVPINRGLFDVSANPKDDLRKGYFAQYQDIEQEKNLQDIIFENQIKPNSRDDELEKLKQEITSDVIAPSLKYAKIF